MFFIVVILFLITASVQAQFYIYKPATPPPSQSQSYSIPNVIFSDPTSEIIRERAARAREGLEIVSTDIVTADGLNYYTETYYPLKVKVIRRRNGQVEYHCLGIKKNGKWNTCEQEIVPLEAMYKKATKESDKNMVLELMEYGNFLLVINDTEAYIIK